MTPDLWVFVINTVIGKAFDIWKYARQSQGEGIPSWEDILSQNNRLQAKIDAEKEN